MEPTRCPVTKKNKQIKSKENNNDNNDNNKGRKADILHLEWVTKYLI